MMKGLGGRPERDEQGREGGREEGEGMRNEYKWLSNMGSVGFLSFPSFSLTHHLLMLLHELLSMVMSTVPEVALYLMHFKTRNCSTF